MSQYIPPPRSSAYDPAPFRSSEPQPLSGVLQVARAFWILAGALTLIGGAALAVLALTGTTAAKVQPPPSGVVAGLVALGGWTTFLSFMAGMGLLWPVLGSKAARRDANETFGRYFAALLLCALGGAGLNATLWGLMARFPPATPGAMKNEPLLIGVLVLSFFAGLAFAGAIWFAGFGRRAHLRQRRARR